MSSSSNFSKLCLLLFNLGIILSETQAEYVFYCNKVMLGLQTGGGLQRIQRDNKSTSRATTDSESRVHP